MEDNYRHSKYNWGNAPLKFHKFYCNIIWLQCVWFLLRTFAFGFVVTASAINSKSILLYLVSGILIVLLLICDIAVFKFSKNLEQFEVIAYKLVWVICSINLVINIVLFVYCIYENKSFTALLVYSAFDIFVMKYYFDRKDLFYINKVYFDLLAERTE